MTKSLILVFALMPFCQIALIAQETATEKSSSEKGIVSIHQNQDIDGAIERFKKYNYSSEGVEGYRIQIFSESGNEAKMKAEKALADYKNQFSSPSPYLTYQQPNFKVRCGDFRTKAEARKYIKLISSAFPSAFIVKDAINVGE